jgi:hypothetical protein
MKLRISPSLQYEMKGTMEDAIRHKGKHDSSDKTYIKIHSACEEKKTQGIVVIDADDDDVKELLSRIDDEIGPNGVCNENISDCYEFSERSYWLGRKRSYKALLKQIKTQQNRI